MKTERISILSTSAFKAHLMLEAEKSGISVSEFVRRRCEGAPTDEDATLNHLATELSNAVAQARDSLVRGLAAAKDALAEAQSGRAQTGR